MVSFNSDLFFGILIGLIAYILLYVGKGIQKYAIEGLKEDKTVKSKHSGIWFFGLALTVSFMGLQWLSLAFFHAPMNLIAPLEGVGLVTLLFFSYFVLKESISKTEIVSVVLVILGTVLVNIVAKTSTELQLEDLNLEGFFIALGIILVPFMVLTFIGWKKPSSIIGILLGLLAGSFMSFQTLAKRVTDIADLALIFTFVTFLFAILTLVYTQFAFTMAKANVVVPSFSSASIILTAIFSFTIIIEPIIPIQIVGIVLIIVGIILMNLFQQSNKKEKIE